MGLKRKIFKTEIVEKPITDATAVPSDVAKGKVFYNNDGRQVGNAESLKTFIYTSNKIKTGNKDFTGNEDVYTYDLSYTNFTQHVTGNFYDFAEIPIPNMHTILGASINGKPVPVSKDNCKIIIALVNDDYFMVGFSSKKMYLKHVDIEKVKTVTIKVYYN